MNIYEMGAKENPALFVIFGGLGDLSRRKLIPALYALYRDNKLSENFGVVAIDLKELATDDFHQLMLESLRQFTEYEVEIEKWKAFCDYLNYKVMGLNANTQAYSSLKIYLEELDQKYGSEGNRIFYMAVKPSLFAVIVRDLYDAGMLENEEGKSWQRVMVEKPFGRNLQTARELQNALSGILAEEKIFRIDHYLGKEMLQNILAIRFSNTIFEALWNQQYIENIQIHATEEIGIENRGNYYEQSGILRDMLQNHILQMLALVCMEPPVKFEADFIRNEKVKVFQSLRLESDGALSRQVITGQYGDGENSKGKMPAYRSEPGVSKDSRIPTFIALKLYVDNFRWAGVPIYIRSGKRLGRRESIIVITFKKLPGITAFPMFDNLYPNNLVIKIQPKEGIAFQINAKIPGNDFQVDKVKMDYCQVCQFMHNSPEAYERLILEALRNNKTLFTRWDELEYSWKFIDHIQDFLDQRTVAFPNYVAGSDGPEEANYLIARDGYRWWKAEE